LTRWIAIFTYGREFLFLYLVVIIPGSMGAGLARLIVRFSFEIHGVLAKREVHAERSLMLSTVRENCRRTMVGGAFDDRYTLLYRLFYFYHCLWECVEA
jgi:hypothetical protein